MRSSPWWWRKGHLKLEGHLALHSDPPLRDAVEGHADLMLHAGLREPHPRGPARERQREIEREQERIRTGPIHVWG
jgi:hypothetical protein